MCASAHVRDESLASFKVRSRTSLPETGEAVVAIRILDCERQQSYAKRPSEAHRHQSSTAFPIAWKITMNETRRCRDATRVSYSVCSSVCRRVSCPSVKPSKRGSRSIHAPMNGSLSGSWC